MQSLLRESGPQVLGDQPALVRPGGDLQPLVVDLQRLPEIPLLQMHRPLHVERRRGLVAQAVRACDAVRLGGERERVGPVRPPPLHVGKAAEGLAPHPGITRVLGHLLEAAPRPLQRTSAQVTDPVG